MNDTSFFIEDQDNQKNKKRIIIIITGILLIGVLSFLIYYFVLNKNDHIQFENQNDLKKGKEIIIYKKDNKKKDKYVCLNNISLYSLIKNKQTFYLNLKKGDCIYNVENVVFINKNVFKRLDKYYINKTIQGEYVLYKKNNLTYIIEKSKLEEFKKKFGIVEQR